MEWLQILGLVIALLVMLVGLLGSILPALPSTPIVLVAAIVHRLIFAEAGPSNFVLGLLLALTLLSLVLDYLASMIGAKKLGATWRGVLGAVVGGVIGIFFSLPGIILGPFLGALAFEFMGGRTFQESTRAGTGAVLGLLFGAVGKLGCCVVMMVAFTISVINNSGTDLPVEVTPDSLQSPGAAD